MAEDNPHTTTASKHKGGPKQTARAHADEIVCDCGWASELGQHYCVRRFQPAPSGAGFIYVGAGPWASPARRPKVTDPDVAACKKGGK